MEDDQYSNNSVCQQDDLHGGFGSLQPPASIHLLMVNSRTEKVFWKVTSAVPYPCYLSVVICDILAGFAQVNLPAVLTILMTHTSAYPDYPIDMLQYLKRIVVHCFIGHFLSLWIATTTARWPSKIRGGLVHISLDYDWQTDLYIHGTGPGKINEAIVPLLLGKELIFLLPWLIKFTNATSSITRTSLLTT